MSLEAEVVTTVSLLNQIRDKLQLKIRPAPELLDYSKSTLFKLESEKNKRSESPDFIFKNPLKRDIFISELSLILDDNFMAKGNLIIDLDSVRIFEIADTGDLTKLQTIQLSYPKPRILKANKEIMFYYWNKEDETEIKADLLISVGA